MNSSLFVCGQRWISNTEAELGLGIVTEIDGRRVTINYPAAAEERVYSIDNAPLSRIEYAVGKQLSTAQGVDFTVTERMEQGGCFGYAGVDVTGESIIVHELDLDSFVHFNKPLDRLLAGQVDKPGPFQLRQETQKHLHRLHRSDGFGLMGPRVQLLPHQFYIAHQVSKRHAPRVLLADEVGLGKTIEAGLIIHQQLFSGRAQRVLVLLPDSLVHQWLVEMLRRFNLRFSVFDEERCDSLLEEGVNPFETEQRVLCPLSLLVNSDVLLEQALAAGWDLLCVDEAHHLSWSQEFVSEEYQVVEQLAATSPGLLLLTATPEQLGIESHFARLRLLDPDRYHDLATFQEDEANFKPLNQLVQQLMDAESPLVVFAQPSAKAALTEYLGDTLYRDWLVRFEEEAAALVASANAMDADNRVDQSIGTEYSESDELLDEVDDEFNEQPETLVRSVLQELIDELVDRHGTGRVLFRNTRQGVEGFPGRSLIPHPLPIPDTEHETFASGRFEVALHPEQIFGGNWLQEDARVEWLIQFMEERLDNNRNDKVLLICSYAETAMALEQHLRLRVGLRTSVFHEDMSIIERDRAAAYFADSDGGAQILICSEIGSEGRNFQFAHQLVMFDLPTNPDLLEQRIGRLDRIGQLHPVSIHVPFYQQSSQEWLFRWLNEGVNAFLSTAPTGEALFERFFDELSQLNAETAEDQLDALVAETAAVNEQMLTQLREGRDRLLELNSCRENIAEEVIQSVESSSQPSELNHYMGRVFDHFGVDQEHHSSQVMIARPSEHMLVDFFPGLTEEGLSLTYSRNQALQREDVEFMTWEHPLVSGVMELIANGETGNTGISTIKVPPIKPGTVMLECYFVPFCPAPKALQLGRYLPEASLRVLVDTEGRDLTNVLTPAHIKKLSGPVNKIQIPQIIRHAREEIQSLAEHAEKIAQAQQVGIIEGAIDTMQHVQQQAMERLEYLAQVNPSIRQDELEELAEQQHALGVYLSQTQLQLDAVRVIIAT